MKIDISKTSLYTVNLRKVSAHSARAAGSLEVWKVQNFCQINGRVHIDFVAISFMPKSEFAAGLKKNTTFRSFPLRYNLVAI